VKGKAGRPATKAADRLSVLVSVRFPERRFEALAARAAGDRVSVPELIRRALAREFRFQK
jgi:hypothetical protein